ncbi:MAG: anthranilate synthase component I family protein [Polyangiaceae bacterium]|nr:anthranilate synthase component I family protein [Polyangiaceae bacterium]
MALVAREVHLAPDPLALARALGDAPGAVALVGCAGESYLGCEPERVVHALDPEPERPIAASGDRARAPAWVGFVPYEAVRAAELGRDPARVDARPEPHATRACWARYGAMAVVSSRGVEVVGDDPRAVDRLVARLARPRREAPASLRVVEADAPADHLERIRAALDHIARGDVYQVNLARRFRLRAGGSANALLRALWRHAPAPYGAAIELDGVRIAGTSPELCLELRGDRSVRAAPIKGTRPRGDTAAADRALAAELDADEKERAELAMIVDVQRNDFGRVAEPGSVRLERLPGVVTHATVHHREALVVARLREGVSRAALLGAALPAGSVTGAPKLRAMELIARLEPWRRGLYTGAFGLVQHDGGMRLGMAIRTLTVRDDEGHYHSGGGIVADSDPRREVDETVWKARQLLALAGELAGPHQELGQLAPSR